MKTAYFTFGQCHQHDVCGTHWDKDIVLKIRTPDCIEPRAVMFSLFKDKWAMQYDEPPDLKNFPRGIRELLLAEEWRNL